MSSFKSGQTGLSKVFSVNVAADGKSIFEFERSFVFAVAAGIGSYVFVMDEFFFWVCNRDGNRDYDHHRRECERRRMVYCNKNEINSFCLEQLWYTGSRSICLTRAHNLKIFVSSTLVCVNRFVVLMLKI